jgi:hypothetical protein
MVLITLSSTLSHAIPDGFGVVLVMQSHIGVGHPGVFYFIEGLFICDVV